MAKFKVGDRVRIVRLDSRATEFDRKLIGAEGTITAVGRSHYFEGGLVSFEWGVDVDGWGTGGFDSEHLEPAIPPAIDAWATEKIRKLEKVDPVTPPVPEEVVNG